MVPGEKRNNEELNFMNRITTILLDIEGTTTSVSFVKDKLFPYVKEHLESYINSHWDDPELQEDILSLKDQAKIDCESDIEGFCPIDDTKESLVKNVLWQMSLDRKTTALKQLQGHIWREGYDNGSLRGHVYSDVAPAFKKWCEENRKLYIFSSGSTEAQKMLFGHSEEGDLLEYISGHFDTSIGAKNDNNSYLTIMKCLECEEEQVLFLTDVVEEAKCARSAGMKVALVVREENKPLTDEEKKEYMTINSFDELFYENSAKRKKMSDGSTEEEVEEKKTENETSDGNLESTDMSQVNGSEEMEVDVTNDETKPEPMESSPNTTDKTANKTEDENKTESEDVEIDVVTEDKKEEECVEVCTANGKETVESKDDENMENNTGEEEVEEEEGAGSGGAAAVAGAGEAKEGADAEPQMDVAEPAPVSDPLEITQSENESGDKETLPAEEPEKKEDEPSEQNNGTADAGNVEAEEEKNDEEKEAPVEADKPEDATESTDEKTDVSHVEESEPKNDKVTFSEDKEMNGHNENSENNGVEEEISINKIVPEDKPDPTVEVKA